MFGTFLPTGHLSFYDPSPHSTNELINVVHLHMQGQKPDFNIVFFCWGGGGELMGNVATCMQLPGKLPFHRVFHRF